MTLKFGSTFHNDFERFKSLSSSEEFLNSIIEFTQYAVGFLEQPNHPFCNEIKNWKVELFNKERHSLFHHQVEALRGCIENVVLSEKEHSGYCFMPTSAGKSYILITLAGLSIGNFSVIRLVADTMPDVWKQYPDLFPLLISLNLEYSKLIHNKSAPRTQILVHDTEILKQLKEDCYDRLGDNLSSKIEFFSVQALGNEKRRTNLKYVIIDECHWGNATEEDTIQSSLIKEIKESGGKAFGFTASPYQDGKFQHTWSENKLNSNLDFNYYLEKNILYPVTLREVNLQNARVGFKEGDDEVDLTEKKQVIDFIADHIRTTLPVSGLDGPAICFFSAVIIPDMVEALFERRPDLKPFIKVLASDSAFFAEKCKELFSESILATDQDIQALKDGKKIFLISRQKLLVGLNAPHLRYCFISPTNSKIIIMQGIGRLMRPIDFEKVPKKLATLFLTSLSGKRLDITGKGSEPKDPKEPKELKDEYDDPKTRYTTTSMTMSEAYDLPVPVYYKTEVGFKDFINQSRIKDGNTVEVLKRKFIDPEDLNKFDPMVLREHLSRVRDMSRAQYKKVIQDRDSRNEEGRKVWFCQGKRVVGPEGCDRSTLQVNLEIHHMAPYTFAELFRKLGEDGTIQWHSDPKNLQHLVTLCEDCHDIVHAKEDKDGEVA